MNCTGRRCIMQFDKVDPATCKCVSYCPQATPPITNADRIRAMTNKELVNFIVHHDCCPGFVADTFSDANRKKYGFDGRSERCEYGDECHECWLDWLRQEATE